MSDEKQRPKLVELSRRESSNLAKALQHMHESAPTLWALVYVDPRDGLLTVSSDGRSHHEQIGIIEKAKMIVIYHQGEE